jgi:hypothetical protein
MGILETLQKGSDMLNENKYFFGVVMISLNIGARFIIDELDDNHRKILNNKFIRRVFIFCAFFMSTKDIVKASFLTIIFIILLNEVFAEELDEIDNKDKKEGGASFNKAELDKTIEKLKTIQKTM